MSCSKRMNSLYGLIKKTKHPKFTKKNFIQGPMFAYFDFKLPFILCTNASGDAAAFSLTQVQQGSKR